MAEPVRAVFRRPFKEQAAAFRLRLGDLVPTARWDDISRAQHDRAFMVAGATKADLLADLAAAVDKAITQGTSLEDFRRDFREIVERRGWHGWTGEGTERGEAWRTKVIYRTNLATTRAAGRYAQHFAGGFRYLVYRHSGAENYRPEHLSWDGLILPVDHPFWNTHYPINGWGCACFVRGARTYAGAIRVGGKPDVKLPPDWAERDPRTGAPAGIDKGWDYAPGATVGQTVRALSDKLEVLPTALGADWAQSWPQSAFEALGREFSSFVSLALSEPQRGRFHIAGVLKPGWIRAAEARGTTPRSADVFVRDSDIRHAFRPDKVDPLDLEWFRRMPEHLTRPDAVLFDGSGSSPALLLVFLQPAGGLKAVIRINVKDKRLGIVNTLRTGRTVSLSDLRSLIGRGVELIDGSL
ncbi:phage head morphogenesis protein [Roseobacter sp. S98]|uniref:phage head morphogenesis protein n=1 Tax=Roseobacter algicola (ex Choi et al. 2025) (nom. illeg.) TaxID=3092138 RepID=UPI003F510E22